MEDELEKSIHFYFLLIGFNACKSGTVFAMFYNITLKTHNMTSAKPNESCFLVQSLNCMQRYQSRIPAKVNHFLIKKFLHDYSFQIYAIIQNKNLYSETPTWI